jgi:hypothetical protein
MVFHLVPPQALERMAEELAGVTDEAGRLVWNSPDLGPPGPYAVLFHDANRALRKRWLELVADGHLPGQVATPHGQRRADRRVRPHPNAVDDVVGALTEHFVGESQLKLGTHEILEEDLLDTLLVPSNQDAVGDRRSARKGEGHPRAHGGGGAPRDAAGSRGHGRRPKRPVDTGLAAAQLTRRSAPWRRAWPGGARSLIAALPARPSAPPVRNRLQRGAVAHPARHAGQAGSSLVFIAGEQPHGVTSELHPWGGV